VRDRPAPLEARVFVAVVGVIALAISAIGVGVVWRMHGRVASIQREALDRQALAASTGFAGSTPTLEGVRTSILDASGRRRAGRLDVAVTAADRAHAGDPAYRRFFTTQGRLVVVRGLRTASGPALAAAESTLPAREQRSLAWVEAEGIIPIGVVLVAGAVLTFERAARRHRERLLAIADVAGRLEGGADPGVTDLPRDEVAYVAATVDGLGQRIERLERARGAYVSRVAHDLRSPLTVIKSYAWALQRGERATGRLERLQTIDQEVDRVSALVDDLLALGRLRAAVLVVEPVDCDAAALVRGVLDRRRALAADRGIELVGIRLARACPLLADPGRLEQVVDNLVRNALDHAHTRVEVSLSADDQAVVLTVSDDGSGIAADDLRFLFDPFFQGAGRAQGTGLGLAIARELIAAHCGTIRAENRPQGGARFVVDLPCASATSPATGVLAGTMA
jgi:signal transduction histidine kinase